MNRQEELTTITMFVKQHGVSEQTIASMRKQFSTRHFTYCMEDDINTGEPAVSEENFSVYLVDSSEHCSKLTRDIEKASGYVIAEILPE